MPYSEGTGLYQDRADYYNSLSSNNENKYLYIYQCVVNLYPYNGVTEQKYIDAIRSIRDTPGLARSWGHASKFLQLYSEPQHEVEEIRETLESLLDSLLEVLPCYVRWVPHVQLPENRALVEYLQDRGNAHRALGNPKFYAYDRVVANIAGMTVPINSANCIYIKGVGPFISQHIRDFLAGKVTAPVTPEERVALTDVQINNYYGGDKAETSPDPTISVEESIIPLVQEDASTPIANTYKELNPACVITHKPQEEPIVRYQCIPSEMPVVKRLENGKLAEFLWSNAAAAPWKRAAMTICECNEIIKDNLDTLEDLPFIGVYFADTIREFCRSQPRKASRCPTVVSEDNKRIQQHIVNKLHARGFLELAYEIEEKNALPLLKSHFKSLDNCTPHAISVLFTRNNKSPMANNLANKKLAKQLWRWGRECPSSAAASYYNAAKKVARMKRVIYTHDDLTRIKYIGPSIAERVQAEMLGIIKPARYREMRRELYRRRR